MHRGRIAEGQHRCLVREQEIEGVLFLQLQIQLECEAQFTGRFFVGAGSNAIIEDIAAETDIGIFVRLEVYPPDSGEKISTREEPDLVAREVDRFRVAIGGFVTHAEFHEAKGRAGAKFFSTAPVKISCAMRLGRLSRHSNLNDCSGGNSRPSYPSGMGGGTFLG